MRVCHICGTETDTACPTCLEGWKARQIPDSMSPEERAEELLMLSGPLEIPFPMVHERIEELMGRPVWTHEMADFGALVGEVLDGTPITMEDIIAKIPVHKLIVLDLGG